MHQADMNRGIVEGTLKYAHTHTHTQHTRSHNDQTYNTHTHTHTRSAVVATLSPSQKLLVLKKLINQGSGWPGDRLVRYQVGGFDLLYVHKRFQCTTFEQLL